MGEHITITGQKHYFGLLPFTVGAVFSLRHEPDNLYDQNAVSVLSPVYGKVGYAAESRENLAEGTISAAECKKNLENGLEKAVVRFIAGDYIIAELVP